MLVIVWLVLIGGLGMLLGSLFNVIVVGYVVDELGCFIGFLEWMMLGMLLVLVFILIVWWLMMCVLYCFDLLEILGGCVMINE